MARPILSKEESECGRCHIPLEVVADRTENNYSKDVVELTRKEKDDNPDIKDKDEKHYKVTKFNRVQNPCYCWRCPNCGLEMTITK
jgi:hypothetical protein